METPPLTRGRLFVKAHGVSSSRNTPAYAGKTRAARSSSCRSRKHPRLRGEDKYVRRVKETGLETPPLTRGRQLPTTSLTKYAGNTPAYAGKTRHQGRGRQDSAETPPLTRGRQKHYEGPTPKMGNTPAYAGKTMIRRLRKISLTKHPRLRGED